MTGSIQPGPEIIRTGTELRPMPLLPEIRLHQAGDPFSMWRCRDRGAGVLVGDLGRRYLPYSRLSALASYDVPGLGALESRDVVRTTVWTLSAQPAPDGS